MNTAKKVRPLLPAVVNHALIIVASLSILLCTSSANAAPGPVDYADPLVGSAPLDQPYIGNAPPPGEETYTGLTFPGPAMPNHGGLLGPLNKDLTEAAESDSLAFPYYHQRRTMIGFSGPMPGLTIMPIVGDWTVPPDRIYASPYDKSTEKASPGYYTVFFPDTGIRNELTTTESVGYYRFTYPQTRRGTILIDLGPDTNSIEIVGDHTVRGYGTGPRSAGIVYFVAEFSKPFNSYGVFCQNIPRLDGVRLHRSATVMAGQPSITSGYAGCYLNYETSNNEQIIVRMASGASYAEAQAKLDAETRGFDQVHADAVAQWRQRLNLIEVEGGTELQRKLFYSTLYNALLQPHLIAKSGTTFHGPTGDVVLDYDRYNGIAFWDSGRNLVVLLTLIEPKIKENILRTHLEMARETGYMSTSFHGDHAVLMYLGDMQRGVPFDYNAVYEYLRKNATDPAGARAKLAEYMQNGWVHDDFVANPSPPYWRGDCGMDKTLEYSWDDHAMAIMALKLGKMGDYKMFLARSHNYQNVFDPSIGFMRGRTADGAWITPYDPREPYYNYMNKEATGWQNMWLVPHDVQGLMNLLGGRQAFINKLDTFFTTPYNPKGIARDVTGMVGLYCQGNEPDIQVPFYYDWAGQPWKTQAVVRKIMTEMYGSDKYGLAYPGNDDQGCMSTWYVMNAMGFYTVDPSTPDYIIGSPIFNKITMHMGNGKDLVIIAKNNSDKNIYIQSATINGKPLNKPWFTHDEIKNGATIVYQMGPEPNRNWGSAVGDAPPSMSAAVQAQ
jgi:predicted alpha-1,2-mannosidase